MKLIRVNSRHRAKKTRTNGYNNELLPHISRENPGNFPTLESKEGPLPNRLSLSLAGKKWLRNRSNKELIIGTAVLIFLVISIVAVTIILLTKYVAERDETSTSTALQEIELNKPDNDPEATVNILSRRVWVAEPPSRTSPLKLPVTKILIVETSTQNCTRQGDCIFIVRHLQTDHKEGRSLWDIRYNFLVGGDGNVYEGRGWANIGTTITNCNENSLGIAFIGSFTHALPPERQVKAARKLIYQGVKRNLISSNYKVVYASQVDEGVNGARSSEKLDETVRKWPQWSNVDYYLNDTLKEQFCNS